jgi:hypothetical protein
MPTPQEIEAFIAAFAAHWQDEAGFEKIMHPGATLLPAGASRPYSYDEAERFVSGVRRTFPDISLRVTDWAARDSSVFTEWEMTGSFAGRRLAWHGINRNTLDGAKSRAAVSCWDRYALLQSAEPGRQPLDLAAELSRIRSALGDRSRRLSSTSQPNVLKPELPLEGQCRRQRRSTAFWRTTHSRGARVPSFGRLSSIQAAG